ncbi:MAG: teichoic acid ABC transporter permease [Bacteroidetes bacterium HGW-Bacteroidetes-16]|jgi:ABC-type polysaccharide/polyol phosphate export permease|nr:MAG: teichoic acid ABC transporter permease [Bacteroidetes bacterium HGW-Bacteroidetes-16]
MMRNNGILNFLSMILKQRYIMYTMVIRDFKSRYFSSIIGLPWAFIQPATYIFVIWFAFTFGLRAGQDETGVPFAPWLIVAIVPWMYISQTMIVTCVALNEYAFLIKKTNFTVGMIPIIKILSGMIVHVILIGCVILLLLFFYGIYPSVYWFQIFYYLFALTVLLSGIAWFVASVNVFISDMAHFVNIIATMLFWATPIVWPFTMLQGNFRYIALFNPFFYITEGYRYTFLEHHWFFEFVEMNVYFWTVTIAIFVIGALTFKKLKPDFGDVL